jgi:hypothetical protein
MPENQKYLSELNIDVRPNGSASRNVHLYKRDG